MGAGKEVRIGRLLGRQGSVILPIDHGLNLGRPKGLEEPWSVLEEAVGLGCDGVLLSLGVARQTALSFAERGAPARVLAVDCFEAVEEEGRDSGSAVVMEVDQAVRLGADAVKVLMPWDESGKARARTARRLGRVVRRAERFELPVMMEPVVMHRPRDSEAVSIELDGARTAMELGADIIKMAYPGDVTILEQVSHELRLPIVILGGPAGYSSSEVLAIVRDAFAAGAAGIIIGRNIWQRTSDERSRLLGEIIAIAHEKQFSAEVAFEGSVQ